MLTRVSCVAGPTIIAAAMVLIAGGTAAAQGSASGPLAQQLVAALDGAQLDSIAAKDTEGDDRYVAALFFPGQLLVVSARYEVPLYADEKIAIGNYRDLYIDLNTAFIAGTKILITDGGADGLRDDDPADSVDTGGRLVRFGGDWVGQQLSQAEYTTVFNEADAGYARMLRALLAEVN
ncbi:MAG: hypothetical protein VX975_04820 [Acidobacteriota bacterium]|nr:hypothetical protein [Acidobacteriota bacterium]